MDKTARPGRPARAGHAASAHVQGRCTVEEKERWAQAATRARITLGEAVREALDEWTVRKGNGASHGDRDSVSITTEAVARTSSDREVRTVDVMAHDPAYCTPELSLHEAAEIMRECDCGELPVVHDDGGKKVIGVITDRDIVVRCVAASRDPSKMTVADAMTAPAFVAPLDSPLAYCAKIMKDNQIRRVPIIDANGKLCGMVSQADIAQHLPIEQSGMLLRSLSASPESAIPATNRSS